MIQMIFMSLMILIGFANGTPINIYPKIKFANQYLTNGDDNYVDSEPLFLTPYIEANKIDEARQMSKVSGLSPELESFSGFLTVNKTYDSNMFFWFFPSMTGKTKNVPILLWLQGGPGGSSLFGLFVENGPLKVLSDGRTAVLRNHTWNKEFAVLFIDNPVGTGFSFTKDENGFAKNEDDVAENLYEALRQFFTIFYEYRNNPFFLTGESYAGKYVPAIGYKIHQMGNVAKNNHGINLQGLAIGDGFCDPKHMFDYGDYLYQVGLIDRLQRSYFKQQQSLAIDYVDDGQMKKAAEIFDRLLEGDFDKKSYFYNVTGLKFYYNILYDQEPKDFEYYDKYLSLSNVRDAIHVGNIKFGDLSYKVESYLMNDIMDSVNPIIEKLLNAKYRILFYSGQLDMIVATPLTENFLQHLQWDGADDYRRAERYIYRLNDMVAGYIRQTRNLYQLTIRDAGHILPYDQPEIALDMITRFVRNESFY